MTSVGYYTSVVHGHSSLMLSLYMAGQTTVDNTATLPAATSHGYNNCLYRRLASYPGHVGGGKSGLVSTVCACAKNPMISWGIVHHRLRTINLYRILAYSPKHVHLELIPQTWQVKARTLIKHSSSLFVVLEREISR